MKRTLLVVLVCGVLWPGVAEAADPDRCVTDGWNGVSLACHHDFRAIKHRQVWKFDGLVSSNQRLYYFLRFPDGKSVIGGDDEDEPCVDPVRQKGLIAHVHYCLGQPFSVSYRSRSKPVDFRLEFALGR